MEIEKRINGFEDFVKREEKRQDLSKNTYLDFCIAIRRLFNKHSKRICADCKECCCNGCAGHLGYFESYSSVPVSSVFREEIKELIRTKFDAEKGFLTNKGCALGDFRSWTCIKHTCDKLINIKEIWIVDELLRKVDIENNFNDLPYVTNIINRLLNWEKEHETKL